MLTFDFFGFLFGVAGGGLLALNHPRLSRWGFVLFMGSNLCWIGFAVENTQRWLLLQTLAYSVTSGFGIWQWFLKPLSLRRRPA